MIIRRFTLVQQVLGILLVGFTVVFIAGSMVMRALQTANLMYIYEQTQQLVQSSVNGAEEKLADISATLYDLVVSNAIQEAGSNYLTLQDKENSLSAQMTFQDTITAAIQSSVIDNDLITCANYINMHGDVRAVASTGYIKLDSEAAAQVEQQAIDAKGYTILIDGKTVTDEGSYLLFVKELREKKALSMRHIGVIILFVDMEKIGEALADAYNGTYILQNDQDSLLYLFNETGGIEQNEALFIQTDMNEKGYALPKIGGRYYFVTEFHNSGHIFSYRVLLPYNDLFFKVEQLFSRFVGIFILGCLGALALSMFLMRRVTMDINRLRNHIGNISDVADIPININIPMHNRDSYELYTTFNTMAEYINRLIRDNYEKQILVKETQLATLQAQINPHFLYNTLNSIYWRAKKAKDPGLAGMIDSLSNLLREATNVDETLITIDKELEIVCHYARIQKQRYAERLNLTFDVAEECSNLMIPKFTLQPMLENAIHYGLECMLEPCDICIRIHSEGDDCVCWVCNKGPAPAENLMENLKNGSIELQGNGIGLLNIDKRIKTVFGEQYGVCVMRDKERAETIVQASFRKKLLAEGEGVAHAGEL